MNFTDKENIKAPVIEEGDWESYIGTKQIEAMPCTSAGAAEILGREVCTDNANDNGDGYLVRYKDGYISWSLAKAFEEAYHKACGLTFGMAIEELKSGKKVCRAGWNGKGMFLALQEGSVIQPKNARGGAAKALVESGEADEKGIVILPHIDMKAANGDIVVGWLASQTDMLSEDWMVVE